MLVGHRATIDAAPRKYALAAIAAATGLLGCGLTGASAARPASSSDSWPAGSPGGSWPVARRRRRRDENPQRLGVGTDEKVQDRV
ncbi:MAG: hypothetical protein KIT31_25255 [Deltaproteobacteria bacterium]|nr:hypothetical protein [Deltaproteobacteria bacterium]